jgi:hypothetical protein
MIQMQGFIARLHKDFEKAFRIVRDNHDTALGVAIKHNELGDIQKLNGFYRLLRYRVGYTHSATLSYILNSHQHAAEVTLCRGIREMKELDEELRQIVKDLHAVVGPGNYKEVPKLVPVSDAERLAESSPYFQGKDL